MKVHDNFPTSFHNGEPTNFSPKTAKKSPKMVEIASFSPLAPKRISPRGGGLGRTHSPPPSPRGPKLKKKPCFRNSQKLFVVDSCPSVPAWYPFTREGAYACADPTERGGGRCLEHLNEAYRWMWKTCEGQRVAREAPAKMKGCLSQCVR